MVTNTHKAIIGTAGVMCVISIPIGVLTWSLVQQHHKERGSVALILIASILLMLFLAISFWFTYNHKNKEKNEEAAAADQPHPHPHLESTSSI